VVFSVTVTTGDGEAVPNGETVTVHAGSVTCTVTLHAGTGTCTIVNSALLVGGPYAVTVSYSGDGDLASSSGKPRQPCDPWVRFVAPPRRS
jgi:hypothetical protein